MSIVHVCDREELKTCPFDKSHRVSALKLPNHIVKCGRNRNEHYVKCPFNATHILKEADRAIHVAGCPDRLAVERDFITTKVVRKECMGNVQVPSYDNDLPESTENWDLECSQSFAPGYDPQWAMSQARFRNPDTMSSLKRAEKKAYRKKLLTDQQTDNGETKDDTSDLPPEMKELRRPKQPPKMLAESYIKKPSYLGLGRGLGCGSRIAADIFGADLPVSRTQSPAEQSSMWLSFGRGRGIAARRSFDDLPGNRESPLSIFQDDSVTSSVTSAERHAEEDTKDVDAIIEQLQTIVIQGSDRL